MRPVDPGAGPSFRGAPRGLTRFFLHCLVADRVAVCADLWEVQSHEGGWPGWLLAGGPLSEFWGQFGLLDEIAAAGRAAVDGSDPFDELPAERLLSVSAAGAEIDARERLSLFLASLGHGVTIRPQLRNRVRRSLLPALAKREPRRDLSGTNQTNRAGVKSACGGDSRCCPISVWLVPVVSMGRACPASQSLLPGILSSSSRARWCGHGRSASPCVWHFP